MPQNPNLIATMSPSGNAYVFDRTKFSNSPSGKFSPQITLSGHKKEGYGISWNPIKEGTLITGSEDKIVALW